MLNEDAAPRIYCLFATAIEARKMPCILDCCPNQPSRGGGSQQAYVGCPDIAQYFFDFYPHLQLEMRSHEVGRESFRELASTEKEGRKVMYAHTDASWETRLVRVELRGGPPRADKCTGELIQFLKDLGCHLKKTPKYNLVS